jgi:hypothetical protein
VKLVEEPYHKSANALLIHHFVVPLLRWRRLTYKSKFERASKQNTIKKP